MQNIQIIHSPIFPENPTNPARAYLEQSIIEINDTAFNKLSDEEREVILRHEIGHIVEGRSETAADSYAIEHSNGKDSQSLVKTMHTLEKVGGHDTERMDAAFAKSLAVAARRGNKRAAKLLGITANATGESKKTKAIFIAGAIFVLLIIGIIIKTKWTKRK